MARSGLVAALIALLALSGVAGIGLAAPSLRAAPEPARTAVAGDIDTDTTWSRAGSPYAVAGQLFVRGGATLTIEPGVEVRFDQAGQLLIEGAVIGQGTADQPIRLHGEEQRAGAWGGIALRDADPPAELRLSHATIAGAGAGSAFVGQVYLFGGLLELTDVEVRDGSTDGIVVDAGAIRLTNTAITGNAGTAINIRSIRDDFSSADPLLDNVTIAGNGLDAIALGGGASSRDARWENVGVPYVVEGQIFIHSPATLTIDPGTELRFTGSGHLFVDGGLIAEGTAEQRIRFAGVDDAAWRGLVLQGSSGTPATGRFAHVIIAGGGSSENFRGQLYMLGALVEMRDSEVRDGAGDGIVVDSGSLTLADTSLTGNAGFALRLRSLATEAPSSDPVLRNLTIAGNGSDAIAIDSGNITADSVWEDAGAPYQLGGQLFVRAPATLTLEPGVEVRFGESGEMTVGGGIIALGTAALPIRLVGTSETAGAWRGLVLHGSGTEPARAGFAHVTLAHAGNGGRAALEVFNASLTFSDGRISDHAADGLSFSGSRARGVIEGSAITDIGGAGIANTTGLVVVAPNNWWGSASGPTTNDACHGGAGTRIEGLVRFGPWLRSADQRPDPLAPADTSMITLTPQRWYAPADGQTRVWVDMVLRDSSGMPVPGATVVLTSTLGSVTSGGITDAAGHTLAYLTSTQTGEAELYAQLSTDTACDHAESTTSMISFTGEADGLLEGMQAPYMYGGIDINPEPVTRGVPTTISARLNNPNDTPITVEASFEFVQAGIGLAFGPVGAAQTKEIPAGAEMVFETSWTPVVSGHYCVQVLYRIVAGPGSASAFPPVAAADGQGLPGPVGAYQAGGGGRGQRNLTVFGGGLGRRPGGGGGGAPPGDKPPLEKAKKMGDIIGGIGGIGTGETFLPGVGAGLLTGWQMEQASKISQGLGFDPPRQDYQVIAEPLRPPLAALERAAGVSDARYAAQVALAEAMAEFIALGDAAIISLDRYGGAASASDLQWASVQASSLLHYEKLLGEASLVVADRLGALRVVMEQEGDTSAGLTLAQATAGQAQLRATGFSEQHLDAARAVGMSDEEIEATRQELLSLGPDDLAGPYVAKLAQAETAFREQGEYLIEPVNFPQEPGREGLHGGLLQAGPGGVDEQSNLARIYDHSSTIVLGNPLDHEATIELRARRISMPVDWVVELSPATVTLAPGEQATVTVSISATTPWPQGTLAEVAVEGIAEGQLLGGVVVGLVVPEYMPFGQLPGDDLRWLPLALAALGAAALVGVIVGLLLLRRRRSRAAPAAVASDA